MTHSGPDPRRRRSDLAVALALAAVLLGVFGLTGSKLGFGYEGQNIAQAEALVRGTTGPREAGGIEPYTQGGALEVAAYLPLAVLKVGLDRAGRLPGLRQLGYVFVIPLLTTVLCLVFYGLVLELYRDRRVAVLLTLLLAFTTTIWPYAKFGMETQQTLWTLAGVWVLLRYRERPTMGAALGFGISLAALALTKITGPLHAVALVLAGFWLLGQGGGAASHPSARRCLAAVVACAAVGAILFLGTNRWRYGGWLWEGRYGMSAELTPFPLWEALWAVLFSPGKSLLLFSPPIIIGLWFWAAFWRRFPAMRPVWALMLVLGVAHLHNRPWADETWGPRRLHALAPLLMLPVGIWIERFGDLHSRVRRLGVLVVLLGLWVQLVAVAFDYTALARVLGNKPIFAQENTVWDPQLCPLRFNLHLAASARHRAKTGDSIPFVYERHYLPWTAPKEPTAPEVYPVDGHDRLDLWYIQQQADWPDRPYWFASLSSYLVLVLAALALGGMLALSLMVRRVRTPT